MEYLSKFQGLVASGKSSGENQSESYIEYTKINLKRTERVAKTLKFENRIIDDLSTVKENLKGIVLTEAWCGDASQTLPIMNQMFELIPNAEFSVIFMEQNKDLMEEFLTGSSRSIPILILLDGNFDYKIHWGPRPREAQELLYDYQRDDSKEKSQFYIDLQVWYNKDRGISTINEIHQLIMSKFK